MKRLLLLLPAVLVTLASLCVTPDFAFPSQVTADSRVSLARSLKKKDGQGTLQALIELSLARGAVSEQELYNSLPTVDSVANTVTDPVTRSLVQLLEARIYLDIYLSQRYEWDRRDFPLQPRDSNIARWSGEQLKWVIDSLVTASVAPREKLMSASIAKWSPTIVCPAESRPLYPTLLDFVIAQGVEIYNSLGDEKCSRQLLEQLVDNRSTAIPQVAATLASEPSDSTLVTLYNRYRSEPWGDIILSAVNNYSTPGYYEAVCDCLSQFPDNPNAPFLRAVKAIILCPQVHISAPQNSLPHTCLPLNITASNIKQLTLRLYKGEPAQYNRHGVWKPSAAQLSASLSEVTLNFDNLAPYTLDSLVIIAIGAPGRYHIIASWDGKFKAGDYLTIDCSSMAVAVPSIANRCLPFVLNATDGSPLDGLNLWSKKSYDAPWKSLGKTDIQGSVNNNFKLKGGMYTFKAIAAPGDSATASSLYLHEIPYRTSVNSRLYTSLPLYRPGDCVQWAVVSYINNPCGNSPAHDTRLRVVFKDPSGNQLCDTVVSSGPGGVATGSLSLPHDMMAGDVHTVIYHENNVAGRGSFAVNDYRLPSFKVSVDSLAVTALDITATISATSYAGYSLPGAKAVVQIKPASWWGITNETAVWSDTLATSAGGMVTAVIDRAVLGSTQLYSLECTVTSPGGENITASRRFSLGKPYNITTSSSGYYNLDDGTGIQTAVIDAMGRSADITLVYRFNKRDSQTYFTFDTLPRTGQLAPGVYDLTVLPADTALAQPVTLGDLPVYSMNGACPLDKAMWIPVNSFATDNGSCRITLGSARDDAHILVVEAVDSTVTSTRFIKPGAGMHSLDIKVPDTCKQASVLFYSVYDWKPLSKTVTIKNTRHDYPIDITVNTLRDKVNAGDDETISIAALRNGKPVKVWGIMSMNSTALRTLAPYSLSLSPLQSSIPTLGCDWRSWPGSLYLNGNCYMSTQPFDYKPHFELWNRKWVNHTTVNIRGRRYVSALGSVTASNKMLAETEMKVELCEDACEATAGEANGADQDCGEVPGDTQTYRPATRPLAFFAPQLSSAADGTLDYRYRAPADNTTWTLDLLLWDDEMKTATLQRDITVSRPLMVHSTVPRFLRNGDQAVLRATVINNSDSTLQTTITAQVPNLNSCDTVIDITAGAIYTVNIPVTVPQGITQIIYSIKASAARYSDAERVAIPILPATQPLVESDNHYLPADSTMMSLHIPNITDGNAWLTVCYNPMSQVVMSLPDGVAQDITSTAAAQALYASCISRAILKKSPALRQVLAQLNDSTLSQLDMDNGAKITDITMSPWATDAMSQTERLQHLAILLSSARLDRNISQSIKSLQSMQQPDGALSWTPGARYSSLWATMQVANYLAELDRRQLLPADKRLNDIMSKAIAYIDANTAQRYLTAPDGDYTDYTFMRQKLAAYPIPTANKAIIAHTVDHILKNWDREPVTTAATWAVIMSRGGYPTVARRIIASVIDRSTFSANYGRHWSNVSNHATASILQAMLDVDPSRRDEARQVAQWLLLNATYNTASRNAAAQASTSWAIASAIPSNEHGTSLPVITDGNTALRLDEPLPGYLTGDVSHLSQVTISHDGELPLYASVIKRYNAPIDSVAATPNDIVAATQRYVAGSGTTASYIHNMAPGDRARHQLVLTTAVEASYVVIEVPRASGLDPCTQLSGYTSAGRLWYYCEVTDELTRLYFEKIPAGVHIIDIEDYAVTPGSFTSPAVTVQSQYNPSMTTHSGAWPIEVGQ